MACALTLSMLFASSAAARAEAARAGAAGTEPGSADTEVCSGRFLAYSSDGKVTKDQHLAGRKQAEDRAFLDLAQQAFASGKYYERIEVERNVNGDSSHPDMEGFDEDIRLVQAGREYYSVNDLLHGGTYKSDGDNHTLTVWYCLAADRFAAARAELRRERDADVARMRARLGALEQGLARDELDWAAQEMSALLGEMTSRVMETETYTSPLTGEEKTFRGWLAQWRSETQRGTDYAMQIVEEAARKVKDGHLTAAEGLLDDAVRADPTNPRVRQIRLHIEDLRAQRAALLKGAADKAAVGKIAGARSDLDAAGRIDVDDPKPLGAAGLVIESKSREFQSYNPRVTGAFYLSFWGLGADVDGSAVAYESATNNSANPDPLLTLGLSCRVRLGRYGLFVGSGGYGFSKFRADSGGSNGDGDYKYDEVLAGFGVRTIRTARRHASFVALGGVTHEHASMDASVPGLESSDSRNGGFASLAVEWRRLSIYVQQGFGFDDEGGSGRSLVKWHDGTQLGLAFIF
jgi:hypothetical protein